jgi:hypothetical protein
MIVNYRNNLNACLSSGRATRMIQISPTNIIEVEKNTKNSVFGNMMWNVCNQVRKGTTIFHFYLNNDTNATSKTYISFPKNQTRVAPLLNTTSISLLEYYGPSAWIGSPFWLNQNAVLKINDLFKTYNQTLLNIAHDIAPTTIDKQYDQTLLNIAHDIAPAIVNQSQSFANNITTTFQSTTNKLQSRLYELQDALNVIKGNYTTIIPENVFQVFNRTDTRAPLGQSLNEKLVPRMVAALQPSDPIFKNMSGTLTKGASQFKDIIGQIKKVDGQLKEKENQTAQRLKDIEFPFGKIPIGLNEAVSLFPLGLGIGFLICASLLGDTIRLRKDFDAGSKRNSLDENMRVDLIAPLWIDPISSKLSQTMKFMILLIPLVVFVVSVYLISNSWNIMGNEELEGIFIGNNTSNQVVYTGLYILSLTFFVYGYWRVLVEIRNYQNKI